jgi:hypothetical protein
MGDGTTTKYIEVLSLHSINFVCVMLRRVLPPVDEAIG